MRRNEWFAQIEAEHGRPAREVIADAIASEQTISGAARKLGLSFNTLYYLMTRLHIETRTITKVIA